MKAIRLLAVLLACVLGTTTLAAGEQRPLVIPVTTKPTPRFVSDEERTRERQNFYRKLYLESYLQHGSRDESWDRAAQDYLKQYAQDRGLNPGFCMPNPNRLRMAQALAAGNCTDPLVCYVLAADLNGDAAFAANRSALMGRIYPGLIERNYGGAVRFIFGNYLLFTSQSAFDEQTRQRLVSEEIPHRMDWVLDPIVHEHPFIISERFCRPPAKPIDSEIGYQSLTLKPAGVPQDKQWMVSLVNGIGYAYLSKAYELVHAEGGVQALAPAARKAINRKHFDAAVRCLQEARKLNPEDVQAHYWLISLALADPQGIDAPALVGESLSRDTGAWMIVEEFQKWLDANRPGDWAAYRTLALACVAHNNHRTANGREFSNVIMNYLQAHPQDAKRLLDDPTLYRALAENAFWRDHPAYLRRDMVQAGRGVWAAQLFAMGHVAQADFVARESTEAYLARGLSMVSGASLEQFRKAVADDPNIARVSTCHALLAAGKTQEALKAIEPAAKTGQPYLLEQRAWILASCGRKDEAVAAMDRVIESHGRTNRDYFIVLLLLGNRPVSNADMDLAMARIAAHPEQLIGMMDPSPLCDYVRQHQLHERFLATIPANLRHVHSGLDMALAHIQIECGKADEAGEYFASVRRRRIVSPRWEGWTAVMQTLAAGMGSKATPMPTPDELRKLQQGTHFDPVVPIMLGYLAGDIDRATTIQRAQATGKDGDMIYYYLMLHGIGQGDVAQARTDAELLTSAHPTWFEAGSCRQLLKQLGVPGKVAPDAEVGGKKDF